MNLNVITVWSLGHDESEPRSRTFKHTDADANGVAANNYIEQELQRPAGLQPWYRLHMFTDRGLTIISYPRSYTELLLRPEIEDDAGDIQMRITCAGVQLALLERRRDVQTGTLSPCRYTIFPCYGDDAQHIEIRITAIIMMHQCGCMLEQYPMLTGDQLLQFIATEYARMPQPWYD